jgi:hypothetical protein
MRRPLFLVFALLLSLSISSCSTKAEETASTDNVITQAENEGQTPTEEVIEGGSGDQGVKNPSIPATEAGLYTAIGNCSNLVIDPAEASSADPRIADRIAANVANCINTKFPQFFCGPIAMDDGSTGSLGDQVCTWKEYQIQGIRIIMTDEYTSAMQAAGSPYYP